LRVDTEVAAGVEDPLSSVEKLSSGSGGDNVEDILKRLENVETDVSQVKSQVSAILAIIPHLATKADVSALETAIIKWIVSSIRVSFGLTFAIAKFVH
jgi:hypothetical protein